MSALWIALAAAIGAAVGALLTWTAMRGPDRPPSLAELREVRDARRAEVLRLARASADADAALAMATRLAWYDRGKFDRTSGLCADRLAQARIDHARASAAVERAIRADAAGEPGRLAVVSDERRG